MFANVEERLAELEAARDDALDFYEHNIAGRSDNGTEESALLQEDHAFYSYISREILDDLWGAYHLSKQAVAEYENNND